MHRVLLRIAVLACALGLPAGGGAGAQERRPSHCIALAEAVPGMEMLAPVAFVPAQGSEARAPVPAETVRITYIDHAMFLIETPGGLSVVTDYNGFLGPEDFVPDVVTMNRAHGTHWTAAPDPRIPHVLPGWNPDGDGPAAHHLDLGEMLVRNVATDIRGAFGGGREAYGNSIFVFEAEGLCIGHLGHLHHVPSPEQFAAIGRLDVVMAPVDGGLTMPLPDMIATLKRFRSAVVIPMHWFSTASLGSFTAGMSDVFRVDLREARHIDVSLRTLPSEPSVVVLQPGFLGLEDG